MITIEEQETVPAKRERKPKKKRRHVGVEFVSHGVKFYARATGDLLGKACFAVSCTLCDEDLPCPKIINVEIWARSHLGHCEHPGAIRALMNPGKRHVRWRRDGLL